MSRQDETTFWQRLCETVELPVEDEKLYHKIAKETGIPSSTVLGWQRGAYPGKQEHWKTLRTVYFLTARQILYLLIGE